jgi:hypothetical protein
VLAVPLIAPGPEVIPPPARADREESEHQVGVGLRPRTGDRHPALEQMPDAGLGFACCALSMDMLDEA